MGSAKSISRIDILHKAANAKGGKCLSKEYTGVDAYYSFICANGHDWASTYYRVITNGSWCPYCAHKKTDPTQQLVRAREIAAAKGGVCLTDTYTSTTDSFSWRCHVGHEWNVAYRNVVNNGSWCPYCTGRLIDADTQLKLAKNLAISKGGSCLSDVYINTTQHLQWQCNRGHIWGANFSNVVQSGNWCPTCSAGLNERIARHAMELLFGVPFPKHKPEWLRNPKTGKLLELDGYSSSLNIAFEYHGQQHYEIASGFKMDQSILDDSRYRDSLKIELCKSHGIEILEIPYTVNPNSMLEWIANEISSDSKFPPHIVSAMTNWHSLSMAEWIDSDAYDIDDLAMHAETKGGHCLSKTFLGANVKHHWQCAEAHEWDATWTQVNIIGTWCPVCAGSRILEPLKELQDIAEAKGGLCLSAEYKGVFHQLLFRCQHGHEWNSAPGNIKKGAWCPACQGRIGADNHLEAIKALAESKGGQCLSDTYLGIKEKHKFKCGEGHIWEANFDNVKRGSWCPVCAGKAVDNALEELQRIALSKGGKCLATECVDTTTKIKFQCAKGHEWLAAPGKIKLGRWCPECRGHMDPEKQLILFHEIAASRGGECLSAKYISSTTKMRWKCAKGHEWEAIPSSVKVGSWCAICSLEKRKK